MSFSMMTLLGVATFLLLMLLASELGRRLGTAQIARHPEGLAKGIGAAEAAVFGLLGLLLAFSFSGAASRFEDRRHLITAEANAIGTAYLRLDLLSPDAQPEMKELFRQYVDARLETYHNTADVAATVASLAKDTALQSRIWKRAIAETTQPDMPTPPAMLLLPALNEMIDITTARVMATRNHPPLVVFIMLAALAIVGALLVGYGTSINKQRSWLHTLAFAIILAMTTYVIIDLEFPRLGLIRVDLADQVLSDLRASMR
ncbi:MAG TPA: hypothetical protein VNO53_10055 [Steroidobacteraceae bacterium]|nr:hypothetical protein [Steroidobacteraceae bacterium]